MRAEFVIRLLLAFGLITATVGTLFYLTTTEVTGTHTVLLTVLSLLASWLVTSVYAEWQASSELRRYGRRAADKLINLRTNIGRLRERFDERTEGWDDLEPETLQHVLAADIENVGETLYIFASLCDTAIRDWQGIIGEELSQWEQAQAEANSLRAEFEQQTTKLLHEVSSSQASAEEGMTKLAEMESRMDELRSQYQARAAELAQRSPFPVKVEPTRLTVPVECPGCSRSMRVLLGSEVGSTGWTPCTDCDGKFAVHRTAAGGIRVGPLTYRRTLTCPKCRSAFPSEVAEGPGFYRPRVCRSCGSMFRLEGTATEPRTASISSATSSDTKALE